MSRYKGLPIAVVVNDVTLKERYDWRILAAIACLTIAAIAAAALVLL